METLIAVAATAALDQLLQELLDLVLRTQDHLLQQEALVHTEVLVTALEAQEQLQEAVVLLGLRPQEVLLQAADHHLAVDLRQVEDHLAEGLQVEADNIDTL